MPEQGYVLLTTPSHTSLEMAFSAVSCPDNGRRGQPFDSEENQRD